MCAPGSTVAVEGIFSVAGYILSPRRMSFTDENFENQLFAYLNRGIFEVSSNKLKLCVDTGWDWVGLGKFLENGSWNGVSGQVCCTVKDQDLSYSA